MTPQEHPAGGIDFSRRYRRPGHTGIHFRAPTTSPRQWLQSLMLVIGGLLGGFGLGLAFAMYFLMDKI